MKWVQELIDGDIFDGELLVTGVTKGSTDKGLTYLNVTFQDKTGSIEGKRWDADTADLNLFEVGKVLWVSGPVNLYKNQLQLKIVEVRKVDNIEPEDLKRFQKVSPIPLEDMIKKLNNYLESFKDPDVKLITNTVIHHFYDKYIYYPAAVRVHHEFGSGILHHSLAMADLADDIAKRYPDLDRDILVAGALLHDVGKTIEYEKPLTPAVSKEGKLIGHISIMYGEFRKIVDELNIKSEVPLLLEHMILSHHGEYEFGSPVLPMTKEAYVLTTIDQLDSKLMIINKALDGVKEGEFTPRVWAMNDITLYKPNKR